MKDPERLLDGGATPAERRLLDAGATEEPPASGAARLMAALVPPLAPPGKAPGPESLPPPAAPAALGSLAAKWGLVAAGAVALGGAVILVATQSGPPADPAQATDISLVSGAAAVSAPPPAVAEVQSAPVDPVEARPSAAPELPRKRVESGSMGGAPSIAREIQALDQVRAFLAKGEGRKALQELERYRAQSPRGALGQEAALLRIEALVLAGEKAAARRFALRFLSDHPGTPHEKRVRALTGASP